MAKFASTNIKKGDTIVVLAGKDKGRKGQVLKMNLKDNQVLVERANVIKKHQKPSQVTQGGIIEKEAGLDISNVALFCPKCKKGVRVGHKLHADGRSVRVCRACGEELDS